MLSEALSGVWTVPDPDQKPVHSTNCSHQGYTKAWAWLDPGWPAASQAFTATAYLLSTPEVIKASLGTANAQLHTNSAHTSACIKTVYMLQHTLL